jgi:phosphocarrier protein HPr
MQKRDIVISNKLGLHARASAKLTQTAGQFSCGAFISRGARRVNAKSIMGVMMLAAAKGVTVTLETDGEREEEAMNALVALIDDKFGEGE